MLSLQALRALKYHNGVNDLWVNATAAAPAADAVNKWGKSAGKNTITNMQPFLSGSHLTSSFESQEL